MTVPNPAVEVVLSHRGWVDFGRGTVPAGIAAKLGIRLVMAEDLVRENALSAHRRLSDDVSVPHSLIERVGAAVFLPYMRPAWSRRMSRRPGDAGSEAAALPPEAVVDPRGMLVSQLRMPCRQIQRLREARGLGRGAAAAAATGLDPAQRVTARMLETIETGSRLTDGNSLIARLDMVYGADGQLGIERSFISRPNDSGIETEIVLPDFWYGPVWLQFSGPDPAATTFASLSWGRWRRECHVLSGGVVTTRRAPAAPASLLVRLSPGWAVVAGTGVVPGALDINHEWRVATLRFARAVMRDFADAAGLSLPSPWAR